MDIIIFYNYFSALQFLLISYLLLRMISCKEICIIFLFVIVVSRTINGRIVPSFIYSKGTEDLSSYPFFLLLRGRTSRWLYRETKTLKRSHKPTLDDVSSVYWLFKYLDYQLEIIHVYNEIDTMEITCFHFRFVQVLKVLIS